jgi:hypothetical protein
MGGKLSRRSIGWQATARGHCLTPSSRLGSVRALLILGIRHEAYTSSVMWKLLAKPLRRFLQD